MTNKTKYRCEINIRPVELGGGWHLKLLEGDQEVGGGVFSAEAVADPQAGIDWFNGLKESEREHWLRAADSARPVDAWAAYLAYQAARDEGATWLASCEQ